MRVARLRPARLRCARLTRRALLTAIVLFSTSLGVRDGLVAAGQATAAQTGAARTTAMISGSLTDAIGRVLPRTTLTLSSTETHKSRETRSDQQGRFSFAGMAAGGYLLDIRRAGFAITQIPIVLAAGERLSRDVTLQIGPVEETVTVASTETPAPIDSPRALRRASGQGGGDACSQSKAGGCIDPPRALGHPRPIYPPGKRDAGSTGQVDIDGRIGTDGFVTDLRLAAPADPEFANAALAALHDWRFTPARLDGTAVDANIHVTVRFVAK